MPPEQANTVSEVQNPNQSGVTSAATGHPYKSNVGKSFRGVKGSASYIRDNEYKVTEFVPSFDFGSGGKKPAYRFERVGVGSTTVQGCAEFLKHFEVLPDGSPSEEAPVVES